MRIWLVDDDKNYRKKIRFLAKQEAENLGVHLEFLEDENPFEARRRLGRIEQGTEPAVGLALIDLKLPRATRTTTLGDERDFPGLEVLRLVRSSKKVGRSIGISRLLDTEVKGSAAAEIYAEELEGALDKRETFGEIRELIRDVLSGDSGSGEKV